MLRGNNNGDGSTSRISGAGHRILIIEARYYEDIADELLRGAKAALEASGATYDCVTVPGALEIPQVLAQAVRDGLIPATAPNARYSGAIALGCVIRGETSHYDIVCNNANHWMMETAIRNFIPVGNAILTVDTHAQAMARAAGANNGTIVDPHNGKGADAVRACLMVLSHAQNAHGKLKG